MRDDEPPPNDLSDAAEAGVVELSDLLGTTWRAVGANLASFALIATVVLAPAIVMTVGGQEWMQARAWAPGLEDTRLPSLIVFTGSLLQVVLQFFAQAAVIFATVEFMAGRRASAGASLEAGFSRIWTILALAVLATSAIGFGLLVCIIPGIVLMCVLVASVPAAVVERLGPIEAMQRSADLTHGHRGTIFAAWLAIVLAYAALSLPLGIVLARVTEAGPDGTAMRIVGYLLTSILDVALAIFQAALAAVFYARVRGVRDGIDADAIAQVFA